MAKKASLPDLSARALLVDLDLAWWVAEVPDKKISDSVAEQHNVNKNAGRYTKKLFPYPIEVPAYDAVTDKLREIQKYYKRHTVPWEYGVRMLKASFYQEFITQLKKFSQELDDSKRKLKQEYPGYVQLAREKMNGMFVQENYPDLTQLDRKFGMSLNTMPVVAPGDFRLELDDALMKSLQEKHAQQFEKAQVGMSQELWKRIFNTVTRAAKLANSKTKVFEGLFNDLDELADTLPSLNMLDDPEIEKMAQAIKEELAGRDVNVVRNDYKERDDVATKAQKLADKMAKFIK